MSEAVTVTHIVVGYDGVEPGRDALAFGSLWCRASGDTMIVVTSHPGAAAPGIQRVDAEWVAYEREEADRLLAEARELVGADVQAQFRRINASSAARALHELADEPGTLVVLGTRRRGAVRRTFPGSTASRLLQGAAAPVLLVPRGYADAGPHALATVAAAYVDTPDGRVALATAAKIAAHVRARLHVLSVIPDTRVTPPAGEPHRFASGQRGDYERALEAAVATLPVGLEVTSELVGGPVVEALSDLRSPDIDLLVCGSRGYGPVRRVFLGGVSAQVVRNARLPVVVVPRGD